MLRPRLIHYNDGHHFHAKRLEPPASLHLLQWPVDEIAGTGADTLVLGLGYGDVYFHRSKVGRVVGQDKQTWESYIDWRILRMVEAGAALGTDQLRAVVERGRQLGVKVYPSLKLQDTSAPGGERCGALKAARGAAVCLGEAGRYQWGYDWACPEVAADKLAVLQEVLDDYEPDGFELDFLFDPRYFRAGQAEAGRQVLTDFVAQARARTHAAGQRLGRPVPLMVRVFLEQERNLALGIDAVEWLRQGLVDFAVAQDERLLTDTEPKPAWLPATAAAHGAAAYYRPPRRVYHEAVGAPHLEMLRALQHALAAGGWAGLYHGYLPWPFADAEHDFLREMAFPEVTARRDKRYYLQPREGAAGAPTTTPDRVLPAPLAAGQTAAVTVHVADDVDAARADGELRRPILTLRFHQFCIEDEVEIRCNGRVLDLAAAEVTDERALTFPVRFAAGQEAQAPMGGSFHWFRFHLEPADVVRGANRVEVTLRRCEPRAAFTRALNGVELHLRYRDMQRPLGLDPGRLAPHG